MFKQDHSSNRQRNDGCFFQQTLRQSVRWFLSQDRKALPRKDFVLKQMEKLMFL